MNYQYPSLGYDNRPVLAGDRQSKQQPMVNSGYFSFRGAAYPSINNSAYSLVPNYEYGPVAGYPVASGYNVDLQERIARAKDINMRYKQSLARTAVLNHHNEVAQVVLPYKITKPVVEKPSVSKQFEHKQFQHQPYQYKYVQNKKAIDGKVLSELSLKSVAPAEQHRAGAVAFEDDEDIELISNDVPTKKMPPVIKKQEDSQPMDYRPGPKDSQLQHSHNYVDEHLKKSTEASISQPDPKLNELASKISQAVAENKNELDSKAKKNKNKKKLDKTELIAENKKKIDSVMKKNANSVILMPLWRHRRNGIMNPPPDKILKGKRLFRVIVKSLLGMFIRYSVVSYKVKLEMREKERQALTRALNIYSESMDDWLAKLVSMPLSSLQQDSTLDFDVRNGNYTSTLPLKTRMIQLKVRYRCVVQNICQSEMPSPNITNFLVTLSADENYFPSGFLWDHEMNYLDFNSLGATRHMLPVVFMKDGRVTKFSLDNSSTAEKSRRVSIDTSDPSSVLTLEDLVDGAVCVKKVNAKRIKLILCDYIFIRILIFHVLLSPWNYGIGAAPSGRNTRKVLNNCRVLSTLVYQLISKIFIGCVPTISHGDSEILIDQMRKQSLAANSAPVTVNFDTFASKNVNGNSSIDKSMSRLGKSTGDLPQSMKKTTAELPKILNTGILGKVLRYTGVLDTTPNNEVFDEGSVEAHLIRKRRAYAPLEFVHALLVTDNDFSSVQQEINSWHQEMMSQLEVWIDKLVSHVVTARQDLEIKQTAKMKNG